MIMFRKLLRYEWFWLSIVVFLGAFLRFWKIGEWQYFTYDQARDYLIVKKAVVDHKFTLVGPTVLAPGVYLPPFYYYSLIPFLLLFKFHLFGPDLYLAFLGTASIAVFYLLAKDFFGAKTALLASAIFSLNPYLIQVSRHAWNPNTICFFTLLFALAFERYFRLKNNVYLVLAAFSLSWALNLHYTVIVFLPLLFLLFYLEARRHFLCKKLLFSAVIFLLFISPIILFEFRHNFSNTNGVLTLLGSQKEKDLFLSKFESMITDYFKMPLTLLAGVNQKENLTINPSHILLFDKTKILFDFKTFVTGAFLLVALGVTAANIRKKSLELNLILIFIVFGFLIRLIFPPGSFYFYHYTFFFPFVFLFVGYVLKKILDFNLIVGVMIAVLLMFLPVFDLKIKNEIRKEEYFLAACETIAKESSDKKVALAANLLDASRWDHNGLEYRYFLEAVFHLPLGGWEKSDYQTADVLYLIDEGDLEEPLRLGGMEMEAFGPKKIEKVWQAKTGQKIYKMTR